MAGEWKFEYGCRAGTQRSRRGLTKPVEPAFYPHPEGSGKDLVKLTLPTKKNNNASRRTVFEQRTKRIKQNMKKKGGKKIKSTQTTTKAKGGEAPG